jgi:hypothetical protein
MAENVIPWSILRQFIRPDCFYFWFHISWHTFRCVRLSFPVFGNGRVHRRYLHRICLFDDVFVGFTAMSGRDNKECLHTNDIVVHKLLQVNMYKLKHFLNHYHGNQPLDGTCSPSFSSRTSVFMNSVVSASLA